MQSRFQVCIISVSIPLFSPCHPSVAHTIPAQAPPVQMTISVTMRVLIPQSTQAAPMESMCDLRNVSYISLPAPLFLSSSSAHAFLQGVLVFPQEVVAVRRANAYHLYLVVLITLVSLRRMLYVSLSPLSFSLLLSPLSSLLYLCPLCTMYQQINRAPVAGMMMIAFRHWCAMVNVLLRSLKYVVNVRVWCITPSHSPSPPPPPVPIPFLFKILLIGSCMCLSYGYMCYWNRVRSYQRGWIVC